MSGLAFAGWVLFGFLIGPTVIRRTYAGTGFGFLRPVLAGRGRVPLDSYLDLWRHLTVRSGIALAALVTFTLLLVVARQPLARLFRLAASDAKTSPGMTLAIAAWLGSLFGLLDFLRWFAPLKLAHLLTSWANYDHVWMGPIGLMILFAGVAAPIAFVAVVVRAPAPGRIVTALMLTLGLYGLLHSLRLGLATWAVAIVATGLATFITGRIRFTSFSRVVRRTLAPVAIVVLIIGAVMRGGPRLYEWYRLRSMDRPANAPNVLLIILDTVRAESLGLYGYARPTTPRIAAAAQAGFVFDAAFAPAPWTLPSHASMFTGRETSELNTDWLTPLDGTFPTVAEVLTERGYATGGFIANLLYCAPSAGIARGFLHYDAFDLSLSTFLTSSWLTQELARILGRRPGRSLLPRKHAPDVSSQALDWIGKHDDRPWFAFLNYLDAHEPYIAHQEFMNRFPKKRPRTTVLDSAGQRVAITPGTRKEIDSYDSSIAYADHYIGILLDSLRARGVLDRTWVMITADHGEQFGEHGLYRHGNSLYMPLLHVPLVIIPPGGARTPSRVHDPVTLADVAATILAFTGGQAGTGIPGRSLMAPDSLPFAPGNRARTNFARVGPNPHDDEMMGPFRLGPMLSVVQDSFHYIRNGNGVEELYDYVADSEEHRDIARVPEEMPVLDRLRDAAARADSLRNSH